MTASLFDYESSASTYFIRLQVKDEHNASIEKAFHVDIADIAEPPIILGISNSVFYENHPIDTFIGQITGSDPEGNPLTFSFSDTQDSEDHSLFTIDSTGLVSTAALFDFEDSQSSFTLHVQVKDAEGLKAEKSFDIELLDANEPCADSTMGKYYSC